MSSRNHGFVDHKQSWNVHIEKKKQLENKGMHARSLIDTTGLTPGKSCHANKMSTKEGGDRPSSSGFEKARTLLRELQVDVDLDDAFVPGLRRAYAIVPWLRDRARPLKRPREKELPESLPRLRKLRPSSCEP